MRNYLDDDRPIKLRRDRTNTPASGRPFVLAVVLCLVAGALIVLDRQGMITSIRLLAQQVVAPIAQQLTGLRDAMNDLAAAPRSEAGLQAHIQSLEQENSQLKADNLRLEQAGVENEFLRQQLQIQREQPWTLLGAEVTVRPPDAGRRVMTIARGTADGVTVGMAVIGQNPGGPAALVGVIETASAHTAEVLLITDVSSQISARVIHGTIASLGLTQGQWQRGSRLTLGQIDRSTQIAPGDSVVSAGLTGSLHVDLDLAAVPANIPIGSVDTVAASGQVQSAELRPFVDPDQVRYVWVILNQDD
ncbi:rod shape-determining protein MreC [Oscillochloris sp. ZM17-4]|nr:rod shape-determining protein MreC [Oscillochloris sp. ZM17-4]